MTIIISSDTLLDDILEHIIIYNTHFIIFINLTSYELQL